MNLEYYKDLVLVLTQKEIKVRYKNTFLGYLWSITHPLFYTIISLLAFKVIMRIQIENYTLFLIAGLFPWQWVTNSIGAAPFMFISNASLIKKTAFPREVVILADVLNNMIHFLLSVPVIVVFVFYYGQQPSWVWLYGIPLLCVIQFFLICGLSMTLASLNLFFRDLERINNLLITALFYGTPIFYTIDLIDKKKYATLIFIVNNFNPFTPLVVSWQNLFMKGSVDMMLVLKALGPALLIFAIGYYIYRGLRWRFAEVL
ncbi:MAG: ABC transporter permease [Planctomycetes bacterium]|nr:ABC transporter permease [Planctomycetota bacterium]